VRPDEIRVLNDSELARQLDEAHKELFNLRFRLATKQLVNHREIIAVKKKIARMETIKRERELASEEL
jgi:large subunit ribosomal protein L29